MPQKELEELARALEQIFLRHRIIGTRANLLWRLTECYKNMDNSAKTVVNHIQWMKSRKRLVGAIGIMMNYTYSNMGMNHNTAKILLWKYENHLIQCGKQDIRC